MDDLKSELPKSYDKIWSSLRKLLNRKISNKQAQVLCLMCFQWRVQKISSHFKNSPKTIYEHSRRAAANLGYEKTYDMVVDVYAKHQLIFKKQA